MSEPLGPRAAYRVFLLLTATRWLPVGLVVAVLVLVKLERGLTVAETLAVGAVIGIVVFALELPTSGFTDAFGRRPVYLTAAVVNVAAAVVLVVARDVWSFALCYLLMGVFRALDSGPLEAWYVDTVHASEPGADVDRALSVHGMVLGGAIALGSVVTGGLIWWDPLPADSAFTLPILLHLALSVAHLLASAVLMREPPRGGAALARAVSSARQAPSVMASGLRLVARSRVMLGLVLAEVTWAVVMVSFESLFPIRLAELVGGEAGAAAILGPTAAAAWGCFALGSGAAGLAARRIGVAWTAMLGRVAMCAGAVVMGLVVGPAALLTAYLLTYGMHGFGGPMHSSLLHRQATAGNRATVLSMNSMAGFAGFSLAAPLLGVLAEAVSVRAAIGTAAVVGLVGVVCYLPARRAELQHACSPVAHRPAEVD